MMENGIRKAWFCKMKIFTVGPVEMYQETLDIRARQVPYFRTEEFSAMMLDTDQKLKSILGASKDDKTVYLTASGTAAMEATIINCFDASDKLLVVNGGTFGNRFCQICEIHNITYTSIDVPFDMDLNGEMLKKYDACGYTGLLVNLDETSIGKLYDLKIMSDFCKRNNMCFVVDAIGAAFIDEINIEKYGIDALIFSSQKALSLAPGMSFVILSKRMIEEQINHITPKSMYFNFKDYLLNFERGQTPFTPAVGVCHELADMVNRYYQNGIENIINEKEKQVKKFRNKLIDSGFSVPKYRLSNAVTPIIIDGYAYELYLMLKNDYDMVLTPNGGEMKDKIVRVGNMGNLSEEDYDVLIENMLIAKRRLGY